MRLRFDVGPPNLVCMIIRCNWRLHIFLGSLIKRRYQTERNNQQNTTLLEDVTNCTELGGACGVMVIVVGNGHGDTSSNPGRD